MQNTLHGAYFSVALPQRNPEFRISLHPEVARFWIVKIFSAPILPQGVKFFQVRPKVKVLKSLRFQDFLWYECR